MRLPKSLATILLSIWLIVNGLIVLFNINFRDLPVIMAIIAIAAGVLFLLKR